MTHIKWVQTVIISFFIASISIIGINYIIDPMQQYRISNFYPIYFKHSKGIYLNAGLAKNYDFNSIILGTSHTANFIISDVEKRLDFNKAVKLCIYGGSGKELSITLKTAIDNNNKLHDVLWGVDILSFSGSIDRKRVRDSSFPIYLYDNDILNDYKYLYSLDTLLHSTKTLIRPIAKSTNHPLYDFNLMYQWQHNYEKRFTLKEVLKGYDKLKKEYLIKNKKQYLSTNLKKSFDENFLDTIKNNPQIHFKIFFPPYSLLHFKIFQENEMLDDMIDFKRYFVMQLSTLPNVTIYDFQIADEITSNLSNYRDTSHYHQKINGWMLEEMRNEKFIVSEKNIDENLKILQEQVTNYNLDSTTLK